MTKRSSLAVTGELADALAESARKQGAGTPAVRGADWRIAVVTAVAVTPGTVDCGVIRARRLETYTSPTVGDQIVLASNSLGNWLALGRTA